MKHQIELEIEDAGWRAGRSVLAFGPADAAALQRVATARLAAVGLAVTRWRLVGRGAGTDGTKEEDGDGDGC